MRQTKAMWLLVWHTVHKPQGHEGKETLRTLPGATPGRTQSAPVRKQKLIVCGTHLSVYIVPGLYSSKCQSHEGKKRLRTIPDKWRLKRCDNLMRHVILDQKTIFFFCQKEHY